MKILHIIGGASKDGAYEISVELHIGNVKASETTSADVTNFNVDTIGPATPTLDELFSGTNKLSGTKYVTKDDITSIIVSDVNSETNLSYSLVRLHQPSDGNWYDFSSSFSLNSLLLGSGLFKNEISAVAQSYNETTKKFNR